MRVHAIVSYNGNNYSGWQKQPKDNSVQEEIEKVLSRILNMPISIQGSGRTDAKVHAINQHFHFDIPNEKEVSLDKFLYSVNCLLPRDIKINSFKEVDEEFHSRFSAKKKEYMFKISRESKNPFKENLVYFYPDEFDMGLLKEAFSLFVGKNNFKDFTSKEEDEDNFVRTIDSITLEEKNNDIEIHFIGDGFMRYQIRFLVGTALAVASKSVSLDYIKNHLDSDKEREITHYKAPGEGLYLVDVIY